MRCLSLDQSSPLLPFLTILDGRKLNRAAQLLCFLLSRKTRRKLRIRIGCYPSTKNSETSTPSNASASISQTSACSLRVGSIDRPDTHVVNGSKCVRFYSKRPDAKDQSAGLCFAHGANGDFNWHWCEDAGAWMGSLLVKMFCSATYCAVRSTKKKEPYTVVCVLEGKNRLQNVSRWDRIILESSVKRFLNFCRRREFEEV